jgi:hypothetical protein
MQCVYAAGTSKPLPPSIAKTSKPPGHGHLLLKFFNPTNGSASQPVVTSLPSKLSGRGLTMAVTKVTLSVFTANVDVQLEAKMASELQRSIKKNPPSKLKYDLVYVSW